MIERKGIKIYKVDPMEQFESFTLEVHNIITKEGFDAFYVFDCLAYNNKSAMTSPALKRFKIIETLKSVFGFEDGFFSSFFSSSAFSSLNLFLKSSLPDGNSGFRHFVCLEKSHYI